MTDKFLFAAVLTAATALASCSTDILAEQQQGQGEAKAVSLTASMDEAVTRAGIGRSDTEGKALCYWHKGDQIAVQTKASDGTYAIAKFYTADATGTTTATFWSESLSGATLGGLALYPYNEKHQFTGEASFVYHLPAEYTYTTVGTDIFSNTTAGTYPTNSTNVPMVGSVDSENNQVTFMHIGGLVVIRIDAMPYASGALTVSADQKLSGDFSVTLGEGHSYMSTEDTETAADKQVTFTFSGATKGGTGVFYLPVATGKYTNLTVTISDSDGANTQTVPYGTLTMSQANVWAISLTTHNGYLRNIRSIGNSHYMVNGREFVDLGLDVLWATMNVGASKAEEAGNYYAWSQTEATNNYITEYYSDKYSTDGETLEATYDAATVNWGPVFRTPTKEEMQNLIDQCTWSAWDTEHYGYTVTSNVTDYTSSSIFLYAGGHGFSSKKDDVTTVGQYMTSTCAGKTTSGTVILLHYGLKFTDTKIEMDTPVCWWGYPVRPVTDVCDTDLGSSDVADMGISGFDTNWE